MVLPKILKMVFNVISESLGDVKVAELSLEPLDEKEPLIQVLLILVSTVTLDGHDYLNETTHHYGEEGYSAKHYNGS
jgi:hypothetical protein